VLRLGRERLTKKEKKGARPFLSTKFAMKGEEKSSSTESPRHAHAFFNPRILLLGVERFPGVIFFLGEWDFLFTEETGPSSSSSEEEKDEDAYAGSLPFSGLSPKKKRSGGKLLSPRKRWGKKRGRI